MVNSFWSRAEALHEKAITTRSCRQYRHPYARINATGEIDTGGAPRFLLLSMLLARRSNAPTFNLVVASTVSDEDRYWVSRGRAYPNPDTGLYTATPLVLLAPRNEGCVQQQELTLAVDTPGESRLGEIILCTEVLLYGADGRP